MIPNCTNVDDDFLTGYYIAMYHLQLPKIITSFHAGISKDSLTQGIYYALAKIQPKTKWQMFGCDSNPIKKYESIIKNGIKNPCDIYNINTMTSINIQLNEFIDQKSIDFYTCDIKNNGAADTLKQILLIREYLSNNCQIILRLPKNWSLQYTSISTILLFCICQFKQVKIFKTPWGSVPRYYLIMQDMKSPISAQLASIFQAYILALIDNPNLPLISQTYFNIYDQKNIMASINQAYIKMCDISSVSEQDAVYIWTDIVERG